MPVRVVVCLANPRVLSVRLFGFASCLRAERPYFFLYYICYFYIEEHQATRFMKKIILSIMMFMGVLSAFAAASVELHVYGKSNSPEKRTVKLQDMGNGVERLVVPIREIPKDCLRLEVHHPDAKAKKSDDGYWVAPNGAIGSFKLDNGKLSMRRCPIHLHGIKHKDKALAAIVKGLRHEYSLEVVAKDGNYEIFPCFQIGQMGFSPYEDIVIDYHTLSGDDANYSGMARAYRKYKLDSGEVKPIKERMKDYPYIEYASKAPEIRVRQAWKPAPPKIEYQTVENEPEVGVYVTFDRVGEIIDMLKAKGVEKAEICLVGWNISGHDGRYPQIFPVEPKLGGEAKLRELIKKAKEAGYLIVCHTNSTDCYTIADTYSDYIVCKKIDGTLQRNAAWSGGRMMNLCAQISWDNYARRDLPKVRDLGFYGLHYIDVISCVIPYDCHDKMHPLNRKQYSDYVNRIMAFARQTFGGVASEGPYDHVAGNLDYALYVSFNVMGKQNPLVDRITPLWQIVYNGIILSNPSAETTNYAIKDAKTRLKQIEFGGRPAFYYHSAFKSDGRNWMGNKDLRCQTQQEFEDSGNAIKSAYDEFSKLCHLQLEFMDSHDEISKDVFRTRWANGDEIISNYSSKDYSYNGKTVKPMAYEYIPASKGFFQRIIDWF